MFTQKKIPNSMNEFLDSDVAQAGGWISLVSSIALTLIEWVTKLPVNDSLQAVMLIGSIIFLYYKIKHSVLDFKIKKENYHKDKKNK